MRYCCDVKNTLKFIPESNLNFAGLNTYTKLPKTLRCVLCIMHRAMVSIVLRLNCLHYIQIEDNSPKMPLGMLVAKKFAASKEHSKYV